MTTFIMNAAANKEMLNRYCEPHGIDPKSVMSISVEVGDYYQIEYTNKDGHYCTILVRGNLP